MPEFGRFIPGFLRRNQPNTPPETTTSGITPEVARADIEKALGVFATLGGGTDIDRAAQMVLQSLQVLSHRLDSPTVLKMLYLDNPEASRMLPQIATDTVTRLTNGQITPDQARQVLGEIMPAYIRVFEEIGVKPATIAILSSQPTEATDKN